MLSCVQLSCYRNEAELGARPRGERTLGSVRIGCSGEKAQVEFWVPFTYKVLLPVGDARFLIYPHPILKGNSSH